MLCGDTGTTKNPVRIDLELSVLTYEIDTRSILPFLISIFGRVTNLNSSLVLANLSFSISIFAQYAAMATTLSRFSDAFYSVRAR